MNETATQTFSAPQPLPAREAVQTVPPLDYPQLSLRTMGAKGRGVVALRRFRQGETIERAPVLVIPDPQWELLNLTAIGHYYYFWTEATAVLVFGFGSFYNHALDPNAEVRRQIEAQVMDYVALRDIEAGEEICVRYGCPLWFDPQP